MTDSADDDNYDGYIPKSVDPGPSMLVATLFFCILLVALLPCFVSLGKKWKRKKAMAKLTADAHNDESESSSDDEGHPNADRPVKNKNRLRDEDGDESVSSGHSKASARTGISSVANSLFNAVLDSAPRGGPNLRPGKLALLHRDQILEAEERCEKEMCDMSYSGRSEDHDGRSIGNSVLGNGSVLGRLDHDAVSIHDAVDAPKPFFDGTHEIVNEKPNGPWYSRRQMAASYDKLLAIAEWDYESRRIFKLGFPFMVQSLLVGGAEAVRVALIGRLIGTTALSAYIVVDLVVGLTTEFMRGFQDALITLCSQALGAENNVLTGQYVQMTVIISTALYIPIFIFWYFMIKPTMSWFGLDQETVDVGQDFAILLLLSSLIHGLDESVHALLDCIGCENYSTSFASLTEVFVTVGVYLEARKETATLQGLGYVYVGVHGVALVLNVILVLWNGWIDPYLEGIIGTFSLRVSFYTFLFS